MKSRLQRLTALESRTPLDPIERAYPGLGDAVDRCYDALCATLPPEHGERMETGPSSYQTVGYMSSAEKMRELGRRLRAGAETDADRAVLGALPLEALAVVGVDAKGFVEMLLSLDERL